MKNTALITGASRGLGRALATALAERGWQLLITARGNTDLQSTATALRQHTNVIAIAGDITDPAHRKALANAAADLGELVLVINNAGTLGPSPLPNLLDYPLDQLANVFAINVTAQLGVLQAVRQMLADNAAILNITSDAAIEGYAGWGGYGASKAALEQISNVLAAENPTWRVLWVDPGDMRTEMHQAAFPGEDISDRELPEASVPGLLALIEGAQLSGRYRAKELEWVGGAA